MTTTTVTLAPTANGRIGVRVADELIGTVKDGGHIVRNADRVLAEARIVRASGYDLNDEGALVAVAARLGA